MQLCAVLHEVLLVLFHDWRHQEVGTACNGCCSLRVVLFKETSIIETMQLVTTNLYFFLPFQQGSLGNIGITKASAVTVSILLHGFFQRLCNTHVVDNQSTFFLFAIICLEHTVHTGNGLHQIMTAHRFIDVHGGE